MAAGGSEEMNTDNAHGLYDKINSHLGTRILEALRAYGVSARILFGNCRQLRHLIQVLEDPTDPAKVMGYDQRDQLQGLFDEAIRHFHNYLASIATLVDHTRNLMKEDFVKAEHIQEYQNKVDTAFATDPFTQFMKDFRNYMMHHAIPGIGLNKTFGSPEADSKPAELNIDLVHLAKWDKWTAPSRKFIEANKPEIRMLKLVNDYEQKVIAFHEEFGSSFQRYYEQEIGGALALMHEWNRGFPKPPN